MFAVPRSWQHDAWFPIVWRGFEDHGVEFAGRTQDVRVAAVCVASLGVCEGASVTAEKVGGRDIGFLWGHVTRVRTKSLARIFKTRPKQMLFHVGQCDITLNINPKT